MKKQYYSVVIFTILAVLFDQTAKWYAKTEFQRPFHIFDDFVKLEYVVNPGIAFGIAFSGAPLIFANLVLMVIVFHLINKYTDMRKMETRMATVFIIGGALGNFFDRFFSGYVVDFIKIGLWPSFNVADAFLTIGAVMMLAFHKKIFSVS